MTEIDRRTPPLAIAVATALAILATVALTAAAPESAPFGALGLLLMTAALVRTSSRLLTYGAGSNLLGIALGGFAAGSPAGLVIATLATVLAWDIGDHGISLGSAVGRNARTTRNLLTHSAGGLLVGGLTAGIVYGTYLGATGGQPIAALVFLLFGAVILASAFR